MTYVVVAMGVGLILMGVGLRGRVAPGLVVLALAVGGAEVAAGGMVLAGGGGFADWLIAVGVAAFGAIFHTRVVLGTFGRTATRSAQHRLTTEA